MYVLREKLLVAWASFMVLISWVNAFDDTERDKTLDLKIGFDLTPNSDGNPLRIRRYDEHDASLKKEKAPAITADSFSDSDEKDIGRSNPRPSKKVEPVIGQSNEEESSNGKFENFVFKFIPFEQSGKRINIRSTKGLRANEYDPEDSPKIHARSLEKDSDFNESEG